MSVTISVNGLSLVHRGSGGVSSATLPDVCLTPPQQVPVPYPNVAVSRDLAGAPDSVRVDGGQPPAHAASSFRMSRGDEAGALGGVASGTVAGRATWLTCSPNVRIEGRGACRLTDKMLHNSGNTLSCAGLMQEPVRGRGTRTLARAAAAAPPPPHKMEIALPFIYNPSTGPVPATLFARAKELGVTYFRLFHSWLEGAPIDGDKAGVEMIRAAGFGAEMTILGVASPWAMPGGRDCHGVLPQPKAFAAYFLKCVQLYFPLGVTRFSVWNEPNHSGFLRAGAYWKTAHAKKRIQKVCAIKRRQEEIGQTAQRLEAEANAATAEGRPDEAAQKGALAKLAREEEKKTDAEATREWKKKLREKDYAAIEKSEGRKRRPRSAYELFDMKENAKLYRKLYLAAYNAVRKDGELGPKLATGELQLWIGELASSGAFEFLRYLFDPAVTGKRGCLRAHALALHPYQYLVPPTKPPDARPRFLPKWPIPDGATAAQIKIVKARNAAIDKARRSKWPGPGPKRAKLKAKLAQSAGIGVLLRVQRLLRQLAREKRLARPIRPGGKKYERVDLYLTEFGYHRERLEKLQADRQVPDQPPAGQTIGRRGLWIQLAMKRAVEAKVQQMLYYHLTYDKPNHEWDSGIIAPGDTPDTDKPDPAFYAFRAWVDGNRKNIKDAP